MKYPGTVVICMVAGMVTSFYQNMVKVIKISAKKDFLFMKLYHKKNSICIHFYSIALNCLFVVLSIVLSVQSSYSQQTIQSGNNQLKAFKAAVVKTDITPENSQQLMGYQERKSTGINDHIFHRIIVLDDGNTKFLLVSTDICILSPVEYEHISQVIKSRFRIDPVNFWWATTHTHSAPEVGTPGIYKIYMGERNTHEVDTAYTSFVEQKLIEGIDEALKRLEPARLGAGWGFSQASINRRAKDTDGKATLGLNPDGPADKRIGLLRIEKKDGSLLALIANYPIHGTVMGGEYLKISGDAPGIVAEYVEEKTGAPLIFINGAAGNLAPIYSVYPDPKSGHLGEFRVLLGDRILEASRKISSTTDKVSINAGSLIVETPRKPDMDWPSDFGSYTRTTKAGENMVRLPIRFLKINDDIAIWSAPVELFCEISNEIRDRSSFPYTFYFGYTNGWFGYLVSEEEYKYGGYEPKVSPFTSRAASDLTEAVVTYLHEGIRTCLPDHKSTLKP